MAMLFKSCQQPPLTLLVMTVQTEDR